MENLTLNLRAYFFSWNFNLQENGKFGPIELKIGESVAGEFGKLWTLEGFSQCLLRKQTGVGAGNWKGRWVCALRPPAPLFNLWLTIKAHNQCTPSPEPRISLSALHWKPNSRNSFYEEHFKERLKSHSIKLVPLARMQGGGEEPWWRLCPWLRITTMSIRLFSRDFMKS